MARNRIPVDRRSGYSRAGVTSGAPRPHWEEERSLWSQGHLLVAGVDEVGRGPLAGPVLAAAVVLPSQGMDSGYRSRRWLAQVRDSKLVPARRREKLAELLRGAALGVGVGSASHHEIDEMGIVPATRLAMSRAIALITPDPEYVLVDAVALPQIPMPHKAIIHGDALCFSIAAASIIAKVARDRIMVELDQEYPGYGFAAHKGYPTKTHLERLRHLGPSPVHRRCYAPVKRLLDAVRG